MILTAVSSGLVLAGLAQGGRLLRRGSITTTSTDSSLSKSFGTIGTSTTVNSGVTYWLNGGVTHPFYGNLNNNGQIYVSQTQWLKNNSLALGLTCPWDGHDPANGNLINSAGALIQLNDIGSSTGPTYTWTLNQVSNAGTIQWCGRGDIAQSSTYLLQSDLDNVNTGLISLEQYSGNFGSSNVFWRTSGLVASGSSGGYNLYNKGAIRLINIVHHNLQNVYGSGCWQIGVGSTLWLDDGTGTTQNQGYGPAFPSQSIAFTDSTATLHLDTQVYSHNSNFGASIYGFGSGNAIEFAETIASQSYSPSTGILTIKMVGSVSGNSVNLNLGPGYTASKFNIGFNPQKYNTLGFNAIFYQGPAPSQSAPGTCSLSAPLCQDLGKYPPSSVPPASSGTIIPTITVPSVTVPSVTPPVSVSVSGTVIASVSASVSASIPSYSPSVSYQTSAPSISIPSYSPSLSIPTSIPYSTSIPWYPPSISIPSYSPSLSVPTSIPSYPPSISVPSYSPSTSVPSYSSSISVPSYSPSISVPSISPSVSISSSIPLSVPSYSPSISVPSVSVPSSTTYSVPATPTPTSPYGPVNSNQPICYIDNAGSSRTLPNQVSYPGGLTNAKCAAACAAAGYACSGTEYGSECWCGNSPDLSGGGPDPQGQWYCNGACSGNSNELCGGSNHISVQCSNQYVPGYSAPASSSYPSEYTPTAATTPTTSTAAVPSATYTGTCAYAGCFTEAANDRALGDTPRLVDSKMTVELCQNYCSSFPSQFFGVEYGTECYCGNSLQYGSVSAPEGDCNFLCPGNNGETCGAGNRLNVYACGTATASPYPTTSAPPTTSGLPSYGSSISVPTTIVSPSVSLPSGSSTSVPTTSIGGSTSTLPGGPTLTYPSGGSISVPTGSRLPGGPTLTLPSGPFISSSTSIPGPLTSLPYGGPTITPGNTCACTPTAALTVTITACTATYTPSFPGPIWTVTKTTSQWH